MANQSIALQARAPQSDPLGGAIRNNAQMINMMMQQQNAQRQNAIAEQTMQIQRAKEARETAMAAPQLEKVQSEAGAARLELVTKAVGHALHTSVNNPTDETLDRAAATLAGIGLNPAEIDREIMPIKQLPLDQRKGALMQSIMSDPSSKAAYEATLPKPKELRLGDRIVLVDENPLSATFNQSIRSEMIGVSPNTTFKKTGGGIPAGRGGAAQTDQNPEDILRSAADSKTITSDEAARVRSSLGPNGGAKFNGWLQQNGIQVVPSRRGAAPAAGGGQGQGSAKGKSAAPAVNPEKAKERADAAQALYDIIVEAQKKGHLVSEKQSYAANRAQELLRGRTYLPGGTAQKTSIDELDAAAAQLARSFVEKGTSGTLNALPEMELFLKSVGGGNATYEARMKTLRNFAKQHGIKLNDYADRKPQARAAAPAANVGKPPQGVSAAEWQHMTPKERKLWAK